MLDKQKADKDLARTRSAAFTAFYVNRADSVKSFGEFLRQTGLGYKLPKLSKKTRKKMAAEAIAKAERIRKMDRRRNG